MPSSHGMPLAESDADMLGLHAWMQHEKMMELLRYEPLWSAIKRRVSEAFDAVRRRSSLALGSLLNLQQQQGPEYSLDSQRSVRRKSGATKPARRVSLLHAPDRNAQDRTG